MIGFIGLAWLWPCPPFLYQLGNAGVPIWDWRVLTNFAIIFLVPGVYMGFGARVLAVAWRRPGHAASGAEDGGRRPSESLLFWLLVVMIVVVIWVVSGRLVR